MTRLWLFLFIVCIGGCERRQHLVEQHLLEFGTIIEITMISGDLTRAERLLREIETRLRAYRKQWHAWEDSDLTRFNNALQQGKTVAIPKSLVTLIRLSRDYYDSSGGLFNPALGKLIAAYGFHGGDADSAAVAAIRRNLPTMQDLQVDGGMARSSNPDLQIDLGGIAKGYAVGLIADYLDRNGIDNYILNAGGDMRIAGNRFGRPWRIGIKNPFAPGVVAILQLEGRHSLFTSGNYQRQYWQGDRRMHHIIDPRSGEPSRGQSSATVLDADPVRADVAATALMVDGTRKTRDLALSLSIDDFLIISDSREMKASASFADRLEIKVSWPMEIIN
ncbi:MAG: FAD:protein FMN transferase [Gammaproteobacteria bacterium]|nr:FAD:protein FMN transferase [Gammaproteobacteria bacterium]MDH3447664.1 FAD:protein FMN transferase [Gammaproteobacteria bacterium]